jgi:hypothetical protein
LNIQEAEKPQKLHDHISKNFLDALAQNKIKP